MSPTANNDENSRAGTGNDSELSFEDMLAASFKPAPTINIGDRVEALVVSIDKENIFLEMGTRVEGFLNRSEFTKDGKLEVKEGQTLQVYVVGRSQGILQCKRYLGSTDAGTPEIRDEAVFMALKEAFDNSSPIEAKITGEAKSGFEVTVMGQKGFCPLSQIEIGYCESPQSHLNKTYTFKIIDFAEDGKNIVLSRKEILLEEEERKTEKLWQAVVVGNIYDGVITAVKKYGAFVDIGGVEGLLHVSEISYGRIEDAREQLNEGQELKVEVIDIDRVKRKVSFSLKSQLEDPWTEAMRTLAVGAEIQGKVVHIKPYGAFIEIIPGLQGLLHVSRLGTGKRHEHVKEVLKTGDTVKVWVQEINDKKKTISLTMEEPKQDYTEELKKLKEEQDEQVQKSGGQLAGAFEADPDEPEDHKE